MKRARNKSILDSVLIEMSSEPTPRRSPRKAGDDLREESHRDHVSEHPSHGANNASNFSTFTTSGNYIPPQPLGVDKDGFPIYDLSALDNKEEW